MYQIVYKIYIKIKNVEKVLLKLAKGFKYILMSNKKLIRDLWVLNTGLKQRKVA